MKKDFDIVVKENISWLSSYVRRRMNGCGAWEDIVQDVFVKAFRAYDDYTEDGRIRAWLARIAENTMKNFLLRSAPMITISLDYEDEDGGSLAHLAIDSETPELRLIEQDTVRQILSIVQNLSETEQRVFTLRYMSGYSVSAIAERLGIPEGTVKSKSYYTIAYVDRYVAEDEQIKLEYSFQLK